VALVGPTGAGKPDFGIALAQQFNAEIINADSRQVYRRLDIGSAKPTAEQRTAVAHHLVDVVDPNEPFDCSYFRRLALAAIGDITRRGKRVLIVGGTGLYIKVLLRGLFDAPSRDHALRARLLQAEEEMPGALHQQLQAVDPQSAARLHPHDRIRLIRALEVYELTGRPISSWGPKRTEPRRRVTMPITDLSVVVLPAPFRPSRVTTSPGRTSKSTP
jgi:tRNA dimethylallyltransferase